MKLLAESFADVHSFSTFFIQNYLTVATRLCIIGTKAWSETEVVVVSTAP